MKIRTLLAAAALSFAALPAFANQIVKIGHVAPLTGESANLGKDDQNGARLAIEELNAKGLVINGQKITLVLDSEDDAADPRLGTQVAQKLVDDGVVAVVGHEMSSTSIPAAPIYAAAGVAQITPSASDPQFTRLGYKTTFRIVGTDAQQGPALADYAFKRGLRSVAVVDDSTSYGSGLANEFAKRWTQNGGRVVSRDAGTSKTVDFKAILTKIKGKSPDAVFYAGEEATGAPFFKQAVQLGMDKKMKFLTGDSVCTERLADLSGKTAANNLTCSEPQAPQSLMQGGKSFNAKYKARFGQPVIDWAPFSYDVVYVIADAMQRANSTDRAAILAALPATHYKGVVADISFDQYGDLKNPIVAISHYVNGVKTPIQVIKE